METATRTTTQWAIDPSHSEVLFKVKHLMISTVTGSFKSFNADVELQGNTLEGAKVSFWADTASVFTNDEKRDAHLRSADFFDSEKHPRLTFRSTRTEGSGSDWKVMGELTIKGVSRPVTLNVEWNGVAKDPYGQTKAGLQITGRFDRREWGLNWNAALEAGGVLVSEEVRILCEVQLLKKG